MVLACLTENLLCVFIGLSTTEYLEMTNLFDEVKEIFEEKLGNLTDTFEDYDYESPEGVTQSDLSDIDVFIKRNVIDGEAIRHSQFEKKIRRG